MLVKPATRQKTETRQEISEAALSATTGKSVGTPVAELPSSQEGHRNTILRAIPAEEYRQLRPHLELMQYETLDLLVEAGETYRYAYFPETSVISVVRRMRDGSLIEAGTIGREGMAGLGAFLGSSWSQSTITAQVPGLCVRMPFGKAAELIPEMPVLRSVLGHFALSFIDQVGQAVACNGRHSLVRRCARWLLSAHDRIDGDTFVLTHDVLAQMLAVRRAGVTEAAGALKAKGLIKYTRGRIVVKDRAGLEEAACECYAINRENMARLMGADALFRGTPPSVV
jgi:CRP-like cAMP-binding protein